MMRILGPVGAVFLALLALFGWELGASFVPAGHLYGGFLLVPAGLMALLIGVFFMRVGRAGRLSGFFAIAALFWLLLLLGYGSMDAMTRTNFPVTITEYP